MFFCFFFLFFSLFFSWFPPRQESSSRRARTVYQSIMGHFPGFPAPDTLDGGSTLRAGQDGRHFVDDIFKRISFYESYVCVLIQIWNLFPMVQLLIASLGSGKCIARVMHATSPQLSEVMAALLMFKHFFHISFSNHTYSCSMYEKLISWKKPWTQHISNDTLKYFIITEILSTHPRLKRVQIW